MPRFRIVVIVLFLAGIAGQAIAEPIFPDGLFHEYLHAGHRISVGEDRRYALAHLRLAIKQHPESRFLPLAERLAKDLKASIELEWMRKRAQRRHGESPAEFLADSCLPTYLIAYPENWKSLIRYKVEQPDDPAVILLGEGRDCIGPLLPQLHDDSPTRAFDASVYSEVPKVPRVSDVALHIIEAVTHCKFYCNASSAMPFHELPTNEREPLIEHIRQWWSTNRSKTVAAGIRAQIPHGDFYAQISMADNLLRVAGNSNPSDRHFGLELLRQKARAANDHGVLAARVLESYGDLGPVQWYCDAWHNDLNVKGRTWDFTTQAMFYVAKHGGRNEWELLREIAIRDLESANDPRSGGRQPFILGSLLNAPEAETSPYAIPLLGLALRRTKNTGSRYVDEKISSQSFSSADKGAEYLQAQTGVDFGYRRSAGQQERSAAIARAQQWWAEVGQSKYTYDYLENSLLRR